MDSSSYLDTSNCARIYHFGYIYISIFGHPCNFHQVDEVLQEAQKAPQDSVEDTATQEVITQSVPAEAAPTPAEEPADASDEKPQEPKTEEAPAQGADDGAKDADAKVVGGSVKDERKNSWPVQVEVNRNMN